MIRKRLKAQEGERKKFTARFTRFGKKLNYKGYSEMTVLLTDITDAETQERVAYEAVMESASVIPVAGPTVARGPGGRNTRDATLRSLMSP